MKDIFIADAHLSAEKTPAHHHLTEFLNSEIGQIRTLVLLGDIFEFWVGYRHCVFSAYLPILEVLQRLHAAGTNIVFVEGNHDFHIGPFFSTTLGSTIFTDSGVLPLDSKRIFLCHGDTIAATPGYLRLRRFFRSSFAQLLIRVLPADVTWKIGAVLGDASRKRRRNKPQQQHLLPEEAIISAAQQQFAHGCDIFVCGHFHKSWQQQVDGKQIVVVGDWNATCNYAIYEDGQLSLQIYQPQ